MLIAILDADVLFPMVLRDTLLRAAAAGCFRVHWSDRILDEVTRNLVEDYGMVPSKAGALREAMEEAFPDASVAGWEDIESEMPNHPKDRHVVAAASAIGAKLVVTSNIRDFAVLPSGVVAMRPDQFLCELLRAKPDELLGALSVQVSAYRRPSLTIRELLERLARIVPEFAAQALQAVGTDSGMTAPGQEDK
ncbi:PIN domain-containing protein [Inquilinus sp. CA228]|uniref:PIN domain-containing protein n=1 Tax=Inquilinus sp. CA228 TaxID=3455609 RepID=UPI003F8D808C